MKRVLTILMFLINCQWVYSQVESGEYNDLLYLKEGSILKIKLLDYNLDSVEIEMVTGKQLKLPMKRIKKVVMQHETTKHNISKPYSLRENKMYFRTQFSILTNSLNKGYTASQSMGYRYKHLLEAGLGFGIDNYKAQPGYDIFPIFGEMRYYILRDNRSPFIGSRIGYSFSKTNEEVHIDMSSAGFFINPALGFRWVGGRMNFDIFIALKLQDYQYTRLQGDSIFERDYVFRRYEIGGSMTF